MLQFRVSSGLTFLMVIALAVASIGPLRAAPGDLDPTFKPAFDDIAALVGADGQLAVQRADGTVAFLHESGQLDRSTPISPGNAEELSLPPPLRSYPYRGFHLLPDGRIFALDPPRIINPRLGLSWNLLREDDRRNSRLADGAVFLDNSVLLTSPLIQHGGPIGLCLRWEAEAGIVYRIEESRDLVHWMTGRHALIGDDFLPPFLEFGNIISHGLGWNGIRSQRFYRVVRR